MEHTPILPATAPLESAERFLPTDIGIEPLSAVARALRSFNREQLGSAIEVLIALLDVADGNPDAEPATWPEDVKARAESETISHLPDDHEHGGDEQDAAYVEWHSRGRHKLELGQFEPADRLGHEDDEEDDPPEEDDDSGQCDEDQINTLGDLPLYALRHAGPGCRISDEDHGAEEIGEREQMSNDVPMLPVFSYEHNIFTDKRVPLGIGNMQSSYITNGSEVRSAESGVVQRTVAHDCREPGSPV